jgi:uncharacterized membrane protein YedE/YeeE
LSALRDTISSNPAAWLAVGGLIIGMVFGAVVFRTNFCTMGSISDIVSFGDYRRFRAWILAGVTALIGTQLLDAWGVVTLSKSMYLGANFNWLGNVLGGLMFGYGMVFAGGCASRNLARVGSGDLRSLLTLIVMGLFAYMAIGGIIGPVRAWLEQLTSINLATFKLGSQGLGAILAAATAMKPSTANLLLTTLIGLVGLVYCFKDESFRGSGNHILSGIGIGLCVIAGWALTGLAFDEMADRPTSPISLTYVRPTADSIEWLQRFTAARIPGFGVATVFGAVLGSFLTAIAMGRFRLTTFSDVNDTRRNLYGAVLMGIGGVMALGCTVGQAITGVSTLALGSYLTFAAIVIGGYFGMKRMEAILMAEV